MNLTGRVRWVTAGIAVTVLAISIAGLLAMHGRFETLSETRRSGPLWIAANLEFEILRMENSLLEFVEGESDVTPDDIRFRFDILWSRVDVAITGQEGAPAAADTSAYNALTDVMGVLERYDNDIQALDGSDRSAAYGLLAELRDLEGGIRNYSLAAKDEQAREDTDARQELLVLSQAAILIGSFVALASALSALLFFLDSRRQRRLSDRNMELAENAQQAYLAKSEFISTVSHELRTPLTSIKGAIAILQGGHGKLPKAKSLELLTIALRNCEKLHMLINDILDFEKLDMDQMSYHFEDIDLNEIVTASVSANSAYLDQEGIECSVTVPTAPIMIRGDTARLEQVMNNLLSNAIKFSTSGDRLDVIVMERGDQAVVHVRDYGTGIPKAFRPHVFDRFAQADSSTTRRVGGTGLGLSITRSIVEAHDGEISFSTEEGVGTTFHVSLPLITQNKTLGKSEVEPALARAE